MDLVNLIKNTANELTIIGTIPLYAELVDFPKEIYQAIMQNQNLHLSIFYESDNDLFYQSLITDTKFAKNRVSFAKLRDSRNRVSRMRESVMKYAVTPEDKKLIFERLHVEQVNLRLSLNVIRSDKNIYICPVSVEVSSLQMYHYIENKDDWYSATNDYINFYADKQKGRIYQSTPFDEMLVMYGKNEFVPRGMFPRKAFYNTGFQRHSVWLLIFNRNGEMLLHQRSNKAGDNWGLWDKSAGGHVNIDDGTIAASAERELIEEVYLPNAEFTKYMMGNPRDIINLGVWKPEKRGYERALSDIHNFGPFDWAYFYLEKPISRTSKRRYRDNPNAKMEIKETKFRSDVFLCIAPTGLIDSEEATKKLSKEVSLNHTLKTIPETVHWIEDEKSKGNETEVFTDDILYIMDYMRDMLEEFSEMIKVTFVSGRL